MSLKIIKTNEVKSTSADLIKEVIVDQGLKSAVGTMLMKEFSSPRLV